MFEIEFRNYDGKLEVVLAAITDWIIEHGPINPRLIILEQSSFIKINVICENYK